MKYPTAQLGGQEFDLYDIAEAVGVTSPPLFNAFKKLIRRGNGAKTERQDLEEAKQSIDRYLRDLPVDDSRPTLKDPHDLRPVVWECRHCARKNNWSWASYDIIPGPIQMQCDYCSRESAMIADGKGFFFPAL